MNMENIEIRVTVEGMQQRLYKLSGYTSRSRSAMGINDKVADIVRLTKDENSIITEFMSVAINEAGAIIGHFFSPYTIGSIRNSEGKETAYTICFMVPQNYPADYSVHIEKQIGEYILNSIMHQWMMLVKPDEGDIAARAMNSSAINLQRILTARKRPEKETITPDNIIEL